ncbi:hypothetical protein WHR41_04118 [Cladosporium halotolerans]|uniref:Uncharacterized protein n=1 Tax=Cladosporium halotolerans TaxID=1052096 RepID=A0AB34KP17_9PEZI
MAQPLPSKEQTLFRHLVQNYESKQYKKGIKCADQILRKHPNHGDTQAMKALVLSCQGKEAEAFELCKLALRNAMKSHVCWHVYGLLYRGVRNYEGAIKAYRFALRLEPESPQIARDLALLQMQMRDYAGLVQSRRQAVQSKPGIRSNWTALAVALHLSGDLAGAEDVLKKFEETLKQPPHKGDLEHHEAVLYKISIIAESGDVQRALDEVDAIFKKAVDRTAVMEMRADYLLKLDKKEEAEKAYRALLNRNAERRDYFTGLEKSLGLHKSKKEDQEKLVQLYQEEANKSERRDAARRIPLDFLEGDVFREHADKYLRRMFRKGVPSTFANVKQLYANPSKKQTIIDLVESYTKETPEANGSAEPNGSVNGSEGKAPSSEDIALNWNLSVNYFLAQHYDYHLSRDLEKASQFVEKAIALNPLKNDYTFHMTRARIIKHKGDIPGASKAMNEAREMDPKDRYINTKCAKYQLRNDENETAIATMGMFTRKEAVGGPLGDLLDMQCVWYLIEDGESYLRQNKLALAFKRFQQVYNIFDTWTEDQFDFHSFSFRKGMIRAYVDMIRWEDTLRQHPFYSRAAQSAVKILTMLHDKPELATGGQVNGSGDAAADKKAAAKARKQAEKEEAEKKAAAAKKATAPAKEDEGEKKKEDQDPQGKDLLKQVGEKPLDEAMKYLTPLLELSDKNAASQTAGFEVYIRRNKYLPALKCLHALQAIDADHPAIKDQSARLRSALTPMPEDVPDKAREVLQAEFLSKQ